MAHKKGMGSTRNGRDSQGQRRGVKKYGGEALTAGSIIVRQCGTKWAPGLNVGMGRDYTIYAMIDGYVKFEKPLPNKKQRISVYPLDVVESTVDAPEAEAVAV